MNPLRPKKILLHMLVGLIIPIIFLMISLYTINDYGETTDEKFDQHIGEFYYYDWSEKGVKGLEERFIPLQRNYGPFFDIVAVASHDILHKKTSLIKNSVASYHFPVIIVSTVAIWIVFIFSYINFGMTPALLSSLTLSLLPRFIGDSQNNLKDTPLMTFFSISLLFYYLAVIRKKIIFYILAGSFLGLTYAIKPNALIILPIIGTWYIFQGNFLKNMARRLFSIGLSLIVAFLTILVVWPYYRTDTLSRFIETYLTFKNHIWDEYILYLGQFYRGHEVPWHYPPVIFGVTTPLFFLVLFLVSLFFIFNYFFKNHEFKQPLLFLLLWIVLPPSVQVLSGTPMYDGIRHFLLILPPTAILVGFSVWKIGLFIKKIPRFGMKILILYTIFSILNYLFIFYTDIRFHPYQIVYFNSLTGGVRGAKRNFDLDYWGQSLKEAGEWINRNLPANSRIWLTLPFGHHFPIDEDRFYLVESSPDYKVNLIRGMLKTWDAEWNYLNPPIKPIYTIKVDGAEILEIYKYIK